MLDATEKPAELQALVDFLLNPGVRVFLVIITLVIAAILGWKLKDKKFVKDCNKYYLIVGIVFICSEIAKQIYVLNLGYEWWVYLPLQFSALPLYTFILMPLFKNELIRDVIKFLTGPLTLYVGMFFWVSPFVLNTAPSFFYVFQSISWHMGMIFIGLFNTIIFRIYTMKYFKAFLISIASISILIAISSFINHMTLINGIETNYFYCAEHLSVYPVINLFWSSTSPITLYTLVFILSFIVLASILFFFDILVAKICAQIAKLFNRFRK